MATTDYILRNKIAEWNRQKDEIRRSTQSHSPDGRERRERIARAKKDYAYFVEYYFPSLATCASAPFHVKAAEYVRAHPNARCVFEWARGHAKSTHLGVFLPMWLKIQDSMKKQESKMNRREMNVAVLVGKSEDNAIRLLSDLQAQLEANERYIADFGAQVKSGFWATGEFSTADGVRFVALGRGQSPRGLKYQGARPDYILVDDIDDDELCRNERRVDDAVRWVREALYGSLGSEGGRFILVGNVIAKKSVLTQLARTDGFHVTRVNILTPAGKPSWPAAWKPERIREAERTMGYRSFQKEYMNNPITEGAVFQQRHIRFGQTLPLPQYRSLVSYTDPSFKNSATADYKATMLVGRAPTGEFHLLRAFAAQCSVSEMVGWHYQISEYIAGKVPVMYHMEANFMQDLMMDEFRKIGQSLGRHIPIIGDRRQKGDKFARIEAMQPLFERGLLMIDEAIRDAPGVGVLTDQLLSFERGSRAHDDAPDALEGAVWLLSQRARAEANPYRFQRRESRRF